MNAERNNGCTQFRFAGGGGGISGGGDDIILDALTTADGRRAKLRECLMQIICAIFGVGQARMHHQFVTKRAEVCVHTEERQTG